MGEQVLDEGDTERALSIFTQLHDMAPEVTVPETVLSCSSR